MYLNINKSFAVLLEPSHIEIFYCLLQAMTWHYAIPLFSKSRNGIILTIWKVKKNISYEYQLYRNASQAFYGFSIILKFKIYIFVSTAILKIKTGSGDTSPPSRFVHLLGVQNLCLRPPTEVKFFLPAILEIFRNL